jgi:predicted flap endonuclease-1-like 5' DNA nuclease
MRPGARASGFFFSLSALSYQLSANQAKRALETSNQKLETSGHMLELNTAVQYVKGIGPRLAEVVATKGITTVEDLLYYLPFR